MSDKRILLERWYDVPAYSMSFKFQFVSQYGGDIKIYILNQPSYMGRATDGHSTHRYGLGIGSRPYICYQPMPKNMRDAKAIASEWAKRTAYYIRYGYWKNT